MEQYKKYKEVIASYGLNEDLDKYQANAKQQRYILQRMPNMYLIGGVGAFMALLVLGLIAFVIWSIRISAAASTITYQNFVTIQLIVCGIAFVSWFIIGPIIVCKARKKNSDCGIAEDVKKMSLVESFLHCFSLRQAYLNAKIRWEIANEVYCDVKDRAVANKNLNNCDFTPLTNEQQNTINDIDNRLTVFINNKYAVMKMFEEYLSRDWGKAIMEGFMVSMLLTMFIFMPYFAADATLNNPIPLIATALACIGLPCVWHSLEYYVPKRAYAKIIKSEAVDFTVETRLYDIESEYNASLDNLIHEYVVTVSGFIEQNAIPRKTKPEVILNDNEKSLYDQIHDHIPFDEQEAQDKETILAFLKCFDNALTRQNVFGHICASAFVLSADGQKALMLHHRIMNDYIYPGGHADGESDLYTVALREVEEETGLIVEPVIGKKIFSIQAAPVKGHVKKGKFVSAHNHYDVLYLFKAKEEDMGKIRIAEDENLAVEWRPLEETYNEDVAEWARPVIQRIVAKVKELNTL